MATEIHSTALVEDGARLGENVKIGPFCHVGPNVSLGDESVLMSHAVITGHTETGAGCILHPHAVLGGVPQVIGFEANADSRLVVGNNCVFREYTTAHTGVPKSGRNVQKTSCAYRSVHALLGSCLLQNPCRS